MLIGIAIAGCSGAPAGTPLPVTSSPVQTTPSPAPTSAQSPGPTEFPLPSGVAWLEDEKLDPGTYWFNGFDPWLQMTVGEGWEVGHFHPDFFDLFIESDKAIGFGRFGLVKHRDGTTFAATNAQAVVDALRSNPVLEITDVGPVSIAGLAGLTIDVRAKSRQTPLFSTPGGDFNFDPEFIPRLHVLNVSGGTMVVMIVARPGRLDEAISLTQPVLASLLIVGP